MEYTKGEWKAHKGMKVTGQAGLTYVADCYPFNERMNRPKLQEAVANARLIASALDLYEACKDYDLAIGRAIMAINQGEQLDQVVERILLPTQERGRKAIAKAERS